MGVIEGVRTDFEQDSSPPCHAKVFEKSWTPQNLDDVIFLWDITRRHFQVSYLPDLGVSSPKKDVPYPVSESLWPVGHQWKDLVLLQVKKVRYISAIPQFTGQVSVEPGDAEENLVEEGKGSLDIDFQWVSCLMLTDKMRGESGYFQVSTRNLGESLTVHLNRAPMSTWFFQKVVLDSFGWNQLTMDGP